MAEQMSQSKSGGAVWQRGVFGKRVAPQEGNAAKLPALKMSFVRSMGNFYWCDLLGSWDCFSRYNLV